MVEENLERIRKHCQTVLTSENDTGRDANAKTSANDDASTLRECQDESHHTLQDSDIENI